MPGGWRPGRRSGSGGVPPPNGGGGRDPSACGGAAIVEEEEEWEARSPGDGRTGTCPWRGRGRSWTVPSACRGVAETETETLLCIAPASMMSAATISLALLLAMPMMSRATSPPVAVAMVHLLSSLPCRCMYLEPIEQWFCVYCTKFCGTTKLTSNASCCVDNRPIRTTRT